MELQFMVMVNSLLDTDTIVTALQQALPHSERASAHSLYWQGNKIDVWRNDFYDAEDAEDPENGFLAYRYRVEVYPIVNSVDLEQQLTRAHLMHDVLVRLTPQVAIVAAFEALL